jgi:hypothetical protein
VTNVGEFDKMSDGLNFNEGTNWRDEENGGVTTKIQDARNRSV